MSSLDGSLEQLNSSRPKTIDCYDGVSPPSMIDSLNPERNESTSKGALSDSDDVLLLSYSTDESGSANLAAETDNRPYDDFTTIARSNAAKSDVSPENALSDAVQQERGFNTQQFASTNCISESGCCERTNAIMDGPSSEADGVFRSRSEFARPPLNQQSLRVNGLLTKSPDNNRHCTKPVIDIDLTKDRNVAFCAAVENGTGPSRVQPMPNNTSASSFLRANNVGHDKFQMSDSIVGATNLRMSTRKDILPVLGASPVSPPSSYLGNNLNSMRSNAIHDNAEEDTAFIDSKKRDASNTINVFNPTPKGLSSREMRLTDGKMPKAKKSCNVRLKENAAAGAASPTCLTVVTDGSTPALPGSKQALPMSPSNAGSSARPTENGHCATFSDIGSFKLPDLESALGLGGKSLDKLDAKTLDKMFMSRGGQQRGARTPVCRNSPSSDYDMTPSLDDKTNSRPLTAVVVVPHQSHMGANENHYIAESVKNRPLEEAVSNKSCIVSSLMVANSRSIDNIDSLLQSPALISCNTSAQVLTADGAQVTRMGNQNKNEIKPITAAQINCSPVSSESWSRRHNGAIHSKSSDAVHLVEINGFSDLLDGKSPLLLGHLDALKTRLHKDGDKTFLLDGALSSEITIWPDDGSGSVQLDAVSPALSQVNKDVRPGDEKWFTELDVAPRNSDARQVTNNDSASNHVSRSWSESECIYDAVSANQLRIMQPIRSSSGDLERMSEIRRANGSCSLVVDDLEAKRTARKSVKRRSVEGLGGKEGAAVAGSGADDVTVVGNSASSSKRFRSDSVEDPPRDHGVPTPPRSPGVDSHDDILSSNQGKAPDQPMVGDVKPTTVVGTVAVDDLAVVEQRRLSSRRVFVPVCTCKLAGVKLNADAAPLPTCQALDSIDGKVIGCSSRPTGRQLLRPSSRVGFMALCERHRVLLLKHCCCPGCGQFCAQGDFYECRGHHSFHRQCQTFVGDKLRCPHCGAESHQRESISAPPRGGVEDLRAPSFFAPTGCVAAQQQLRKDLAAGLTRAMMGVGSGGGRRGGRRRNLPGYAESVADSVASSLSVETLSLGLTKKDLQTSVAVFEGEKHKKGRPCVKSLCSACKTGDLEGVAHLLAEGIDPCAVPEDGTHCALHAASRAGHDSIVQLLLQYGAEANTLDRHLHTPLMHAAEAGHCRVIGILIRAGAVITCKAQDGMTVLHLAAKSGRLSAVQTLLATEKIDINVKDDGGWTPMTWAAEHRHITTVRYLLSRGADPNLRDNELNTGLHWAAYAGSADIAQMLLDAVCDLESPNEHGDRPLHIAVRRDNYDCVTLFLDRHAVTEAVNKANETPLKCCQDESSPVYAALKLSLQLRATAAAYHHRYERLVHSDITRGRENNSISVMNGVDDEGCPSDFLYVSDYVEAIPMNVNRSITSLRSCSCENSCTASGCKCARSSIKCWYDKDGHLPADYDFVDPPLIFECNRACRCFTTCQNRVVQLGATCRLQVFRTKGRGWGCRTLLDIAQGTFVCEYFGEIISDAEADRREDDSYLFDLDNQESDTFCIDAKRYGNVSRFVNHLCEPNLVPLKVFVDHQDQRFPRMCFFATRAIQANEELGFDYGDKFWVIKWKEFTCTCGSAKCRYSSGAIGRTLEDYNARMREESGEGVGAES